MIYKFAKILYYSGTGNSYRAARWIEQAALESGASATLQSIYSPYPNDKDGGQTLAAFVCPTHGFIAPWPMVRFAMRLPRQQGTHALVIATRGGTKFGSLYVPGFDGTAAWLISLILRLKGFRIRGIKGIDMPATWTSVIPNYGEENARKIIAHTRPKAMDFINRVLTGKQCLQGWFSLLLGIVFFPISLAYLFFGRFFLAKTLYASTHCNGCGLCAKHCPSQAIRMVDGKQHKRPYWTFSCHSCMRCMNLCPQQAIEGNYFLVVGMIWLSTLPLDALLMHWLGQFIGHSPLATPTLVQLLLYTAILLGILWVLYALFHLLLSMPWFNLLVTKLSPTHYYKRYNEPDTDLKNV
jgi:ferredoxin